MWAAVYDLRHIQFPGLPYWRVGRWDVVISSRRDMDQEFIGFHSLDERFINTTHKIEL